jgi:hypothetical protein
MNKSSKFYLFVFLSAVVLGGILYVAYDSYVKHNTVNKTEYVDKKQKIVFSIDSCSPFIKCLSEDVGIKDWNYTNNVFEGEISDAKNIIHITRSIGGYDIDRISSSKFYSVVITDSTTKRTDNVQLNIYEQHLISKTVDKFFDELNRKEKLFEDSVDQALKVSLHDRFYPNCK